MKKKNKENVFNEELFKLEDTPEVEQAQPEDVGAGLKKIVEKITKEVLINTESVTGNISKGFQENKRQLTEVRSIKEKIKETHEELKVKFGTIKWLWQLLKNREEILKRRIQLENDYLTQIKEQEKCVQGIQNLKY